jgi:RecA-family ATPase
VEEQTPYTYTPLTVRELMRLEIPEPEWLIEGVAVAGAAILLSGREKSGKGWLCIDMACSIASGEPFLGRAVMEGPCLYLALEENVGTVRERIRTRLGGREDVPVHVLPLDGST